MGKSVAISDAFSVCYDEFLTNRSREIFRLIRERFSREQAHTIELATRLAPSSPKRPGLQASLDVHCRPHQNPLLEGQPFKQFGGSNEAEVGDRRPQMRDARLEIVLETGHRAR